MMKNSVTMVSRGVLTGFQYSAYGKNAGFTAYKNEVISNFPLQMALFFNVTFFPVWLITIAVMLPMRLDDLPQLNTIILGIALVAVVATEVTRLYMGYLGNLTENIPGLAGFWMLSLLLQTPLQLLLFHPALQPSLAEIVCQAVMCCLLACQLISGCVALHRLAHHSSAKFHISQFLSNRDEDYVNVQ